MKHEKKEFKKSEELKKEKFEEIEYMENMKRWAIVRFFGRKKMLMKTFKTEQEAIENYKKHYQRRKTT